MVEWQVCNWEWEPVSEDWWEYQYLEKKEKVRHVVDQ